MTPQDIEAIIALVQSHHRRGTLDSHGVYLLRNDLHHLNRLMMKKGFDKAAFNAEMDRKYGKPYSKLKEEACMKIEPTEDG